MSQNLEREFAEHLGSQFFKYPGHELKINSMRGLATARPQKEKKKPALETAEDILRFVKIETRYAETVVWQGRMDKIGNLVSETTGIPLMILRSPRRHVTFVRARHMFFWICREYTPLSFPAIGAWCGNRHHTTAMYGAEKVAKSIADYPELEKIKTLLSVEAVERMGLI